RRAYASLTDRDHRIDIANGWASLALRHHETSFHPDQTDAAGEQRRQRAAAGQAAAILFPMAQALPDPNLSPGDLRRIAALLDRLIGLLAFGAPAGTPEAAELEQRAAHAAELRDEVHRLLAG